MNEFKVGLLALAAISSIIFMSLKITSNQSGFGDYVEYQTSVQDAAGIFPKTPIRVAGINSGRIKSIDLKGNSALITFEVLERVKVTKDSLLKIKSVGFLGDKYIEIVIGQHKERLPEGSEISATIGGGMEDLTRDASEVLQDVKVIMEKMKKTLAPEDRESPMQVVLDNVVQISRDIKDVSSSMKRVISDNEERLNQTIENIESITARLEYHLDENKKDSLMRDMKQVGPMLADAKEASRNLNIIIRDLKEGRGTVGKLLRDEEIIDQVSSTLSGVQKLVGRVESIQTELEMYVAGNTEFDSKSDFFLSVYPSPERFYLFGITTNRFGPKDETEITTTTGGTTSVETRVERDKNTFTFNAQIGRRIHNWGFRAGLIESTGGIGVDYHIPTWSSRFTFELFDYREDLGPNVRLSSFVHLWNVFYAKLAFEDLISKNDQESITFGAGLKFNDEDLRGLIGFFL